MLEWTDQQIETLKTLWREGLSAADIAMALGNGATRSAVIGKAHRLKLTGRTPRVNPLAGKRKGTGNPGQPRTTGVRKRRAWGQSRAVAGLSPVLPAPFEGEPDDGIDVTRLIGIESLNDHVCRWPVTGEGAQTLFCGACSPGASPYCSEHHARAHSGSVD